MASVSGVARVARPCFRTTFTTEVPLGCCCLPLVEHDGRAQLGFCVALEHQPGLSSGGLWECPLGLSRAGHCDRRSDPDRFYDFLSAVFQIVSCDHVNVRVVDDGFAFFNVRAF